MNKSGFYCAYIDKKDDVVCVSACIVDKSRRQIFKQNMFFTKDYKNTDKFTDALMTFFSDKKIKIIEYTKLPEKESVCSCCGKQENIRVPWK